MKNGHLCNPSLSCCPSFPSSFLPYGRDYGGFVFDAPVARLLGQMAKTHITDEGVLSKCALRYAPGSVPSGCSAYINHFLQVCKQYAALAALARFQIGMF